MKQILSLALLISIVACGNNKTKNAGHSMHKMSKTPSIIGLMHQPMMEQAAQYTKNPDRDFLVNMIPHHYGAILSAEELLKTTTNAKLITLASNIISAQKSEIAEFSNIIATLSTNSSYDEAKITAYQTKSGQAMQAMMQQMASVPETANTDLMFLYGMIPHHSSAVADSQEILTVSTNPQVIEIANRIINDQNSEIATMQEYINELQ